MCIRDRCTEMHEPQPPVPGNAHNQSLERRLDHLLQSTSSAVIVVDAETILEANPAAVHLLRWDLQEQLVGHRLPELLSADDIERVRALLATSFSDAPPLSR